MNRLLSRLLALILLLLSGWAQAGGSYSSAATTYSWIDPSAHTNVPWTGTCSSGGSGSADDATSPAINLGFTFTYGATAYTQVYIHSNGRIGFGNTYCGTNGVYSNTLNNTLDPVSGLNLDPRTVGLGTTCSSASCYVRYATLGSAGSRQFVVSFVNVPRYGVIGTAYTFQIILNEADGSFVYQYSSFSSSVTPAWQLTTADYATLSAPAANSAIRFSTYLPTPVAWYKLDENSWSGAGSITDSSGSGNPASPLGGISATTAYVCNGANIPNNTAAGTIDAISTPFTLGTNAALRSAGTVTFWWKAATAWNSGTAAQLLDATTVNGRWFYLVRRSNNTLRFVVFDSNSSNRRASTGTYTFAANTWHHIAVTWNFVSGSALRVAIWVDGAYAASNTTTAGRTVNSSVGSLYVGDNRSGFIDTTNGGTGNSANGVIDEVHVYSAALGAAGINADKNATHACTGTLHHIRVEHDGSASTCAPETIVIKACADVNCLTDYTGGVTNITPTATSGTWSPTPPVSIPAGSSSVNVTLTKTTTGNTTLGTTGTPSPTPSVSSDCYSTGSSSINCTLGFSSGFSFNVLDHASGVPQAVSISTCDSSYAGAAKPLKFSLAHTDPASSTTNGGVVAGSSGNADCASGYSSVTTSVPGTAQISPTFNSATSPTATFSFCYPDVGKVTLNVQDDAGSITGSDVFVARPYTFALSSFSPANPGASDATGGKFTSAGSAFTATVKALNRQYATTPSFGKESSPEGVILQSLVFAPAGKSDGTLTCNGSASDCKITGSGAFTSGTKTLADFAWSEVGIMTVAPRIADGSYLGSAIIGTTGTIAAGSNSLTVASAADISVGAYLAVAGTGLARAQVTAVSGTTITLDTNAINGVTNARVYFLEGTLVGRFSPHHFALATPTSSLPAVQAGGRGSSTCNPQLSNFNPSDGTLTSGSTAMAVIDAGVYAVGDALAIPGGGSSGGILLTAVTATDTGTDTVTLANAAGTDVAGADVFQRYGYSYMGEPVEVAFGLEARNTSDAVTTNYVSGATTATNFAKFSAAAANVAATGNDSWGLWAAADKVAGVSTCRVLFDAASPYNTRYSGSGCPAKPVYPLAASGPRVAASGTPTVTWTNGVGSFDASVVLNPMSAASGSDGPFNWLGFGVAPQDADGAALQTADKNFDTDTTAGADRAWIGAADIRQGRIRLFNAFGSDLLSLNMQARVEQCATGSTGACTWQTNTTDACTAFDTGSVAVGNCSGTAPTVASVTAGSGSNAGIWTLQLKPAASGVNSCDVALNLGGSGSSGNDLSCVSWGTQPTTSSAGLSWAQYPWCSGTLHDPNARATFGTAKNRFIYLRERY